MRRSCSSVCHAFSFLSDPHRKGVYIENERLIINIRRIGIAARAAYTIGLHRTEVNSRFGPEVHIRRYLSTSLPTHLTIYLRALFIYPHKST